MNSSVRNQLLLFLALLPIVGYVTYREWEKLNFGFSNEASREIVKQFAESFPQLPKKFGDWEYVEDAPTNESDIRAANITAYSNYKYRNTKTNTVVSAFLSTGPALDICIHTPQQCYPGAGMAPINSPQPQEIFEPLTNAKGDKQRLGSFLSQRYKQSEKGVSNELEVWWSFNAEKEWIGVESPRAAFSHRAAMYKLYVIKAPQNISKNNDSSQSEFLQALLPVLNKKLFAHEKAASAKPSDAAVSAAETK